eukprot:CAMPEP_0113947368 /NCGR_PEP_ID=MMETSP1339-20121228/64338_1 /TAXON_ID=94617 /ORGANISM="Fibrocapsa japonica" /LENGTH=207 /DNA_ID=CAMNT_0000953933 /DNA_START=97 /DNA_END=717 /DNA_ORIENTATION=+ /assembly_acc=CAM_ASM_000762
MRNFICLLCCIQLARAFLTSLSISSSIPAKWTRSSESKMPALSSEWERDPLFSVVANKQQVQDMRKQVCRRKDLPDDLDRQVSSFEVTLSEPMGLNLVQLEGPAMGVVVDSVESNSLGEKAGVVKGDRVVATSATMGDQLWKKNTLEGVMSALNTRFFMGQAATLRLERRIAGEALVGFRSKTEVKESYIVALAKPLGLELIQGQNS